MQLYGLFTAADSANSSALALTICRATLNEPESAFDASNAMETVAIDIKVRDNSSS